MSLTISVAVRTVDRKRPSVTVLNHNVSPADEKVRLLVVPLC
jgi:hypothetical protein